MKELKSLGVKICAESSSVPANTLSNEDIIKKYNLRLKSEWVNDNIGIKERHWIPEDESEDSITLASDVLRDLINQNKAEPSLLIVATVSSPLQTPASACVIQAQVTPESKYPAFDITSACAGFVFAVDIGIKYVQSGLENVYCIATETRSKFLDKSDRRTVMLFGDAAAGVVLTSCEKNEIGIFYSKIISHGKYWNSICVENKNPVIKMNDAQGIFEMASQEMAKLIEEALRETDLKKEEVDHFIFHQASKNIVLNAARNLELSDSQFEINFDRFGNTTSASVALLLDQQVKKNKIKKNDLILMISTGGGFSAGVIMFRWEK